MRPLHPPPVVVVAGALVALAGAGITAWSWLGPGQVVAAAAPPLSPRVEPPLPAPAPSRARPAPALRARTLPARIEIDGVVVRGAISRASIEDAIVRQSARLDACVRAHAPRGAKFRVVLAIAG